ncbi:T9SS type A sorting domain-containing protein [bacterium]|nr:T9SS type A sorting domain-containing protein [bacterium]
MYKNIVRIALIAILITLGYSTIVIFGSYALKSSTEPNTITSTLRGVAITNKTHGFAVGDGGVILEYRNGCWTTIDSPTEHTLYAVSMVDDTLGFAVGLNGTILKYNGISWDIFDSPTQKPLYGISMANSGLGFIAGDMTLKFDGESWLEQEGFLYGSVIDMYNEIFGIIVKEGDSFIYNGTNWSHLLIDQVEEEEIEDICIISDSTAFGAGFDVCAGWSVVYKYNWDNWTFVCGTSGGFFTSISMINETWGFIVGYDSNGNSKIWEFDGVECTTTTHPIVEKLWDVEIIDATCGFAVGDNGTILKWNGESWSKENIGTTNTDSIKPGGENLVPTEFALHQNFPNPFNPTTTVCYHLPESGFTTIEIFNIAGQLIETLVREHKSSGFHSVEWNTPNVGSGIYFYRMKTGNFINVKKCVKMK